MIKVTLSRTELTDTHTLGELLLDGKHFCFTLELPWRDNAVAKSCIPAGTYHCQMMQSPHFGRVYHVLKVNGRSHILIHAGNTTKDTNGCILVGSETGEISKRRAVLNSRETLKRLHAALNEQPFELKVKQA